MPFLPDGRDSVGSVPSTSVKKKRLTLSAEKPPPGHQPPRYGVPSSPSSPPLHPQTPLDELKPVAAFILADVGDVTPATTARRRARLWTAGAKPTTQNAADQTAKHLHVARHPHQASTNTTSPGPSLSLPLLTDAHGSSSTCTAPRTSLQPPHPPLAVTYHTTDAATLCGPSGPLPLPLPSVASSMPADARAKAQNNPALNAALHDLTLTMRNSGSGLAAGQHVPGAGASGLPVAASASAACRPRPPSTPGRAPGPLQRPGRRTEGRGPKPSASQPAARSRGREMPRLARWPGRRRSASTGRATPTSSSSSSRCSPARASVDSQSFSYPPPSAVPSDSPSLLHPHSSLTCVWEEPEGRCVTPAKTVFASTDREGTRCSTSSSDPGRGRGVGSAPQLRRQRLRRRSLLVLSLTVDPHR